MSGALSRAHARIRFGDGELGSVGHQARRAAKVVAAFTRYALSLAVAAVILTQIMPVMSAFATETVTFPDSNLEADVRTALSKPTGDITDADMATLQMLSAQSRGIRNLSGLEYATRLINLDVRNNQITDISPLAHLTLLRFLYLTNNWVNDISALNTMSSLSLTFIYYNHLDLTAGRPTSNTLAALTARNVYIFYNPQSPVTITATAGAHGAITPAGVWSQLPGGDSSWYHITPDAGYRIADVKVDGVSVGATPLYQFHCVVADHTIEVTFAPL